MNKIRNFIFLSFGLSWTIWLFIWLLGMKLGEPISQVGTVLAMWMPALAYFILRKIEPGHYPLKAGFKITFRKNWKYYLLAIWLPAFLTVLGAGLYFLIFRSQFSLEFASVEDMLQAVGAETQGIPLDLVAILQVIVAVTYGPIINSFFALGEEIGWRGYLYPAFRETFSSLHSHLLTGLIWSLWHLPLNLQGYNFGSTYLGAPWLGLVAMFVFCFSIGVLLSFMMEKTGSLWAPALLHGAVNASAGLGILFQIPSEQSLSLRILGPTPLGLFSGLPFVIVALIILFKRKDSQL